MRLNTHLGAGRAMSTGRIHDPEGAKTLILSFKTATGAALAISRQNIKLVCFADVTTGRLRVDADATAGEKQDNGAQGRRMILIYKPPELPEILAFAIEKVAFSRAIFSPATIVDYYSATIEAAVYLAEADPHLVAPPSLFVFSFICSRIILRFRDNNRNILLLEPRSINILRNYPLDVRQTTNGAALGDPAALEAALHRIKINIAVGAVPF